MNNTNDTYFIILLKNIKILILLFGPKKRIITYDIKIIE